jgi:hypothetical protein
MTTIRYWGQVSAADANTNATNKQQTSQVADVNNTFNQQMYDMLLGSGSDSNLLNMFNSDIPSSLLDSSNLDSATQAKLANLHNNDMSKVLAAKISSALPFSDLGSNYGTDKKQNNDYSTGGLNSFIDLTIKKQIAEAKKQIEKQQTGPLMTVQDFINKQPLSPDTTTTTPVKTDSVDMFASNIRDQIQAASDKFNIPLADLQQKIIGTSSQ